MPIPDLLELVDDPDKDISILSLRALALIGPNKALETELVEGFRDPCPRVRQMAVFAIGAMGEGARDAVPRLASMLKDEDRGVQMHAMLALSRVSVVQKSQLCRLIEQSLFSPAYGCSANKTHQLDDTLLIQSKVGKCGDRI